VLSRNLGLFYIFEDLLIMKTCRLSFTMFNILCIYTTAGRNINHPLTKHFIHTKDTSERRSKESAVLKLSAEVISKEGIQPACN
jgi:hypothetical protein